MMMQLVLLFNVESCRCGIELAATAGHYHGALEHTPATGTSTWNFGMAHVHSLLTMPGTHLQES